MSPLVRLLSLVPTEPTMSLGWLMSKFLNHSKSLEGEPPQHLPVHIQCIAWGKPAAIMSSIIVSSLSLWSASLDGLSPGVGEGIAYGHAYSPTIVVELG